MGVLRLVDLKEAGNLGDCVACWTLEGNRLMMLGRGLEARLEHADTTGPEARATVCRGRASSVAGNVLAAARHGHVHFVTGCVLNANTLDHIRSNYVCPLQTQM